jgi:hypothetical protein
MPAPTRTDLNQVTAPLPSEAELVQVLLTRMSFEDRWRPVAEEMQWVIGGCKNPKEQKKILPAYCYPILDAYRRTVFKNLPTLEDTIFCIKNPNGTVKKLRIDWRNMGRAIGIGKRGVQFFDLQAMPLLKAEGLLDLKPEKEELALKLVFGKSRLRRKLAKLNLRPHRYIKTLVEKCRRCYFKVMIFGFSKWSHQAYQAGPEAFAEFNAGVAAGLTGFLDADANLVGENNRASNYQFFLLAWPEMKELIEKKPLPTRTEVFNWLMPYSNAGLCKFVNIEQFRDFCEDIKLKFAGRTPKKDPMPSA